MKKRNIYMVQATNASENSVFLPYSTGTLVSSAFSEERVREFYDFKGFVILKDKLDNIVNSLEDPYLIGFSNNIWNSNFNKLLAQKLKERFPDCIVMFGGRELPFCNAYLEEYAFIDILLHLWGEKTFPRLLLELSEDNPDLSDIPNLSYRGADGSPIMTRTDPVIPTDFPSPYLTDLFEPLIASRPDINFLTVIETNRGCPFQCTYCNWDTVKSKMVMFPLERVFAEIDWIADHKADYCACCDSNFGIFKRDEVIADKFVETKRTTGFPIKLQMSAAKASSETVYRINKKMNDCGMSKGATISVQTLCDDALVNIDRQNIPIDLYKELMIKYKKENIPTFTDVLLGLPGETYDSFCSGLCKLVEAGQHTSLFVYSCNLLTNSIMWQKEYREKYKIKTVDVPFFQYHCNFKTPDEPVEYSKEIASTSTLSTEEFIDAKFFAHALQCFHCFGLLQFFAIYLYAEKQVPYIEFYRLLLDEIGLSPGTVAGGIFKKIRRQLVLFSEGKPMERHVDSIFGDITWPLEEGAYLEIVLKFDEFYSEIDTFLRRFDIEPEIYKDLFEYQKAVIRLPGRESVTLMLDHDIHSFFRGFFSDAPADLKKQKNTTVISAGGVPDNWKDYSKYIVWFSRKGRGTISTDIDVEYR
jgi:radical SAM superfamily enzyme YgiQ (UPF0313 family)